MKTCTIFVLLVLLCAHSVLGMDLRWTGCPSQIKNTSVCATAKIKLFYNDPTSRDINFFVRRYNSTSATPTGTIIVLGGLFGGSAAGLYDVSDYLFDRFKSKYNIFIPDIRGTGRSNNLDTLLTPEAFSYTSDWQKRVQDKLGKNYFDAFSVDTIAYDIIDLVASVRNNTPVYVYGLYSGSYIIHRVLQISPNTFDAVVMDGVCAGKYCNATLVDVNRNEMARKMLKWYMDSDGNELVKRYGQGFDAINTFKDFVDRLDSDRPICGATSLNILPDAAYRLFSPNFRILIPVLIHRYSRCNLFDTSDVYELVKRSGEGRFPPSSSGSSSALELHLLLSEFARDGINKEWARQYTASSIHPTKMLSNIAVQNWQVAPKSLYYESIANYTKPMLMMNGGYDQFSPLENATSFANHFSAPLQKFVPFPADGYWLITRTPVPGYSSSCADTLMIRFLNAPNTPLNATCVDRVIKFSFNYTPITTQRLGKGNIWDDKYTPTKVTNSLIGRTTYFAFFVVLCAVLFIALVVQRDKQPIRSRHIYPYLGLFYVFVSSAGGITWNSLSMAGAYAPHVALVDVVSSVLLQLCGIASVMQMLRFLAQKYIYKRMGSGARYNLALFKFIARERTFRLVVVLYTLFWACLWAAFYTAYIFMGTSYLHNFTLANDAVLCFFAVIALLLFFYDIFIADRFKLLRTCGWKSRFITDDPLMFRLEATMFIPCIIAGAFNIILSDFTQITTPGAFEVVQVIYFMSVLLMSGGLISIVRAINLVKELHVRRKHKNYDMMKDHLLDSFCVKDLPANELLALALSDARGLKIISDYCEHEFSLENLEAYKHLKSVLATYPSQTIEIRRRELAIFLEQFLERNSPYELNLPSNAVDAYRKVVNSQSFDDPTDAMVMWKKISDSVYVNLMDTFSRVKKTSEFEEYHKMLISEEQITSQFHTE